jgi:hypothetical protein
MKARLVMCGICEHWHMPKAHNGHCPACGTTKLVIHHKPIYINWLTERTVIKSGWPVILKRLINLAAQGE